LDNGDLYINKISKTENYTGWKEGKLILRNDPLPIQLKRIERWFSVKFNIKDKRINESTDSYWATFEEENLDEVLELLSLSGRLQFVKHSRKTQTDGTYGVQEIDVSIR
jgi:ferric-dicitrate binding protein FerR (iron transport regulator)